MFNVICFRRSNMCEMSIRIFKYGDESKRTDENSIEEYVVAFSRLRGSDSFEFHFMYQFLAQGLIDSLAQVTDQSEIDVCIDEDRDADTDADTDFDSDVDTELYVPINENDAKTAIAQIFHFAQSNNINTRRMAAQILCSSSNSKFTRAYMVEFGCIEALMDLACSNDFETRFYSLAALDNLSKISASHETIKNHRGYFDILNMANKRGKGGYDTAHIRDFAGNMVDRIYSV